MITQQEIISDLEKALLMAERNYLWATLLGDKRFFEQKIEKIKNEINYYSNKNK